MRGFGVGVGARGDVVGSASDAGGLRGRAAVRVAIGSVDVGSGGRHVGANVHFEHEPGLVADERVRAACAERELGLFAARPRVIGHRGSWENLAPRKCLYCSRRRDGWFFFYRVFHW